MKGHLRGRMAALLMAGMMLGCSTLPEGPTTTEIRLPLSRAWFNGQTVEYIVTDVSDAAMASMMGAHHAPRLRAAIGGVGGRSLVDRVYKFADDAQISVFESAPLPSSPDRQGVHYSPLWRVVEVRWVPGHPRRELRSEKDVLAAQDRGEVRLTPLDVVVNCPVIRSVDGVALRGARP